MTYIPYDMRGSLASLGFTPTVVSSGGRRVRFFTQGRLQASSKAVVFVHGINMASTAWIPVLEAAHHREIDTSCWVLVDVPGFGGSTDLGKADDLATIGDLLVEALERLAPGGYTLVGHSMGGFLSTDIARRHSDRCNAVMNVCGSYFTIIDFTNARLAAIREAPRSAGIYFSQVLASYLGTAVVRFLLGAARYSGVYRLLLLGLFSHALRVTPSVFDEYIRHFDAHSSRIAQMSGLDYPIRDQWSQLSVPLHALFGADDLLVGKRDVAALRDTVPTAQVVVVKDAAHFLIIENPFAVLDELHLLLQKTG